VDETTRSWARWFPWTGSSPTSTVISCCSLTGTVTETSPGASLAPTTRPTVPGSRPESGWPKTLQPKNHAWRRTRLASMQKALFPYSEVWSSVFRRRFTVSPSALVRARDYPSAPEDVAAWVDHDTRATLAKIEHALWPPQLLAVTHTDARLLVRIRGLGRRHGLERSLPSRTSSFTHSAKFRFILRDSTCRSPSHPRSGLSCQARKGSRRMDRIP
jgi:hypothetical protein